MAANPYPNLGWNPVPGVSSEVSALQNKVQSAATALRRSHGQIERLLGESDHWEGDAADAFRDALSGDLPLYMKNAARSLEKAAAWLNRWDGDLTSHSDLAKKYDREAGERKAAAEKAKDRHETARKNPDLDLAGREFPDQAEADAATARLRAAERSLNEAATLLENATTAHADVIKKARELEEEHGRRADFVAGKLDDADDKLAPREPGWLSRTLDDIGEVLKTIGEQVLEHAGTIGAITGLLACLPTPFAPIFLGISIAASAASLGKNLASEDFRDSLSGKYGQKEQVMAAASVGGDVLGMLPGIGALGKAGGEAGLAVAIAKESGEAVSLSAKANAFTKEIVPAITQKADDVKNNAGLRDYALNGINSVANVGSSLESENVLPDEGAGHDSTESVKGVIAATGARAATADLLVDLSEFAAGVRL